ncbi:DEAD/DEAH box helicase family protein [Marinifilum sp.]|uniref:DEAD/DEAH box helicase family protein n=1 Tax=Marinifilum sp. TaxID=2033137 RepID=UPI003BAA9483
MKSNFHFFNTEFSDLAKLGQLAERNLHEDPQTTMSKLRLLCERIASYICQLESFEIETTVQFERLNFLKKEDIIPGRVLQHFHSIRKLGNKAVHYNEASFDDSLLRLRQAWNVSVWFYQNYSEVSDFLPEEFIVPQAQISLKETTEKLEQEIEILRIQNQNLLQEKQNLIQKESQRAKQKRREFAVESAKRLDISEKEARLVIDEALKKNGWEILHYTKGMDTTSLQNHAVEEYPTESGPVDYALFVEGKLLGMLEAKRPSTDPQNVLDSQTKRYAKTVKEGVGNWYGYKVPFLYASNSDRIFHLDVRSNLNTDRQIYGYHTPEALKEKFERDEHAAETWLVNHKVQHPWIRNYQENAIKAVEETIIDGKTKLMLAMATGTGKTFTAANLIYRLLRSKKAKRILFLVDRRSLAVQTVSSFHGFETPDKNKLNQEYEIYSQKFSKNDFQDEKFDNEVLPKSYLTNPDGSKTYIYVATIQRMAYNLLGKSAKLNNSDESDAEEDVKPLDIPIHAFDVVIADECHRGYTSRENNIWRQVLNHFDAIKIGLTATPAAHTVAFFDMPIFEYPFNKAVEEGYLCDYDPKLIHSKVKIEGAFLKEGELIGEIDDDTKEEIQYNLEAEREYRSSEIESKITVPDTNKKILMELKKHCDDFEKRHGRFPKTLIFAANDKAPKSHADQLVTMATKIFGRGHDFVKKITGNKNVDKPLQLIKQFRNRQETKIVVTVDMLSTGVDIPELEFIVFLRPVKSRILWEQMLGRGTRKCDEINKECFYVFDCFGGTLFEYFKNASKMSEEIKPDTISLQEVIERIFRNEDRSYNLKKLMRRLRRIEKTMSGEAYEQFEPFILNGDIKSFTDQLEDKIQNDFINTMKLLRNKDFQDLLLHYKRPRKRFTTAYNYIDEVHSEELFKVGESNEYLKPQDYLLQFKEHIEDNKDIVEAYKIILERPADWNTNALMELRNNLKRNGYPVEKLRKAHKLIYDKELIDIISMIKHAVYEEEPLLSINERIDKVIQKVFSNIDLTLDQLNWVEYIKEHLKENLTIDEDDFRDLPIFTDRGGWNIFKTTFGEKCETIIKEINKAIAI